MRKSCGAASLARGDWADIKARNLHDNLHDIVSRHWQAAVRQADDQQSVERTYARHLGESYAKAQEVRAWLRDEPRKALILAYLTEAKLEGK